MTCNKDMCTNPVRNSGLCNAHYTRAKRDGTRPETPRRNNPDGTRKTCIAQGCSKAVHVKGWCHAHYTRMYRHGSTEKPQTRYLVCPVPSCEKHMLPSSVVCKSCYQRSWRYGISPERFISMSQPENKVCGNPGCSSSEKLHIDHDHSCCVLVRGQKNLKACGNCVRGWLCNGCNTALGLLKEDTGRIEGLIEYLRR